jgi:anti-sigma factor RsiW
MPEVEDRMTRYLLGELSPEETLQVETEYFRDDDCFESIQALEDQLLRDFVRGEMDPELYRRFQARYRSSPELAEKIEFAQAVFSGCRNLREEERQREVAARQRTLLSTLRELFKFDFPAFQYAAAAVALLGVGLGYYEWTRAARLKSELAQFQDQNKSLAQQKSALDRALADMPKRPPLVASFVLMPGVSRDQSRATVLSVPDGLGSVEFKLPLPPGIKYASFRAVLQRVPDTKVSIQDLQPGALVDAGKALKLSVPSVSLKAGQYILFVKGRSERGEYEDVQYYAFGVEK